MSNNKKAKILSLIAMIVLLISIVGLTFAYFRSQGNSSFSQDVTVTAGTTDLLSFQINKDIDMTVNQNNFAENAGNVSDSATLTARLRPNSGNGQASDNYNIFFIIDRNDLIYTTEGGDSELLLTITDPAGRTVEQITGLRKDGTSFDITTKTGAILIAANYPISATNNIEEIQSWTVTVTMVNLESEQNANGGKRVTGKLFLTKENLNDYTLTSISGTNTDLSGVSNVTTDSITLNLNVGNGSENVESYHYAIEEESLAYLPAGGSIVKLSSSPLKNVVAINEPSNWYQSNEATYTFTNLTPNTVYKVYAYAIDAKGFTSNIYSTLVKTSSITLPKVSGVFIETTGTSISVDVTALDGENNIDKYYYSIDNGETWVEGTDSHTFNNLVDSAEYDVKVKVVDTEGNESSAFYERAKTVVYQEAVINNVVVTQTSNSITLSVEATRGTNGISKYLYSIDNGETWVEGTSTKTFSGLTSETNYTIKVKAVDTKNTESAVYEVSITTGEYELPQITAVKVRQLPTSLTISVTGVEGTNPISKYYYSIQNGVNYVSYSSDVYVFDNLSSNATYYIKVYAEDSEGRTSAVYSTSAKTEYVVPVINSITKTESANSIILYVDAEGKSNEIDYYMYRLSDNDEWSTSATSEITIGSLTSDTEYSIQVKAIDTDNHESSVTRVIAKTSYVNPVVNSITVVNQTWDSITVRANTTVGSHQISKYYFKTDQSSYVESNTNEYTFTGLNDGGNAAVNYEITAYVVDTEYNVNSGDNKGKSELTKVNTATTAYTLPQVSVTNSTTSSSITLNATATQGSGAISKYSYSVDGGTTWVEQSSSNTTNSYTFTGLNDNTSYNVKVKVTDVNNREATYSGTITTDYIEPIINGVTNSKTWNSITLTINATAGSTAIDKYFFRTSTGSYDSGQASNEKTFSGLTEDTEYTFYVKLVDVGGHEVTEQSVTVRTNDYNEPTLALNGAIQTTYNTVTVNVTGAANETGATIVSYSFKIDSETPVVVNSSSTSASHTFNVAEDQTHSIEVNMTDSFGRVATVTSTGIATPAYVTSTITSVTASDETTNSIKVTVVASDGQNAIRGYKFSTNGGTTYGSVVSTTSHNYEYTLTGLNDNTTYSIKVKAVDDLDRESNAGSTSATTSYLEPTVTCSTSGITWGSVTVNASATAGSTAISTYKFKKGSEGFSNAQSGSSYTFTALDPGTQYAFTVEVTDTSGHTTTGTCNGTTASYTYINLSNVSVSNVMISSATITATATDGTGTISTYEYKLSSSSTWIDNGSSNVINISNLDDDTTYEYEVRVKDSNNMYSNVETLTFTTLKIDLTLDINYSGNANSIILSNTTKTTTCNGNSVTWNDRLGGFALDITNQSEINCSTTMVDKQDTKYLANFIKGEYTDKPNAGTGNEIVHEYDTSADLNDTVTVKSFNTSPTYFKNSSYSSTAQSATGAYWTFDSSSGVFTSASSLMTSSGYYHAFIRVPETNHYKVCYHINKGSSNDNLYLYDARGVQINLSLGYAREGCKILGKITNNGYLNMSVYASGNGTPSEVTFRLEKAANVDSFDTGYRFEGSNPNNYVWYNNEFWRIIGVFSTEYDSTGNGVADSTADLVKIIKEDAIGRYALNEIEEDEDGFASYSTNWPTSSLYHFLNEVYYNKNANTENIVNYCNNIALFPHECYAVQDYIKDDYRDMIANAKWYLGGPITSTHYSNYSGYIYKVERDSNYVFSGNDFSTLGYLGLMYMSDYAYAVLGSNCARGSYGLTSMYESDGYRNTNCSGKNWLYGGTDPYITSASSSGNIYIQSIYGEIDDSFEGGDYGLVRPVLYLKPNVLVYSGDGTIDSPYMIGM